MLSLSKLFLILSFLFLNISSELQASQETIKEEISNENTPPANLRRKVKRETEENKKLPEICRQIRKQEEYENPYTAAVKLTNSSDQQDKIRGYSLLKSIALQNGHEYQYEAAQALIIIGDKEVGRSALIFIAQKNNHKHQYDAALSLFKINYHTPEVLRKRSDVISRNIGLTVVQSIAQQKGHVHQYEAAQALFNFGEKKEKEDSKSILRSIARQKGHGHQYDAAKILLNLGNRKDNEIGKSALRSIVQKERHAHQYDAADYLFEHGNEEDKAFVKPYIIQEIRDTLIDGHHREFLIRFFLKQWCSPDDQRLGFQLMIETSPTKKSYNEALQKALLLKNAEVVKSLLQQGASLTYVRDGYYSNLQVALNYGKNLTSASASVFKNILDIIAERKQVEINTPLDTENNTALHLATLWGFKDTVQKLHVAGALLSLKNREGKTALQIAEDTILKRDRWLAGYRKKYSSNPTALSGLEKKCDAASQVIQEIEKYLKEAKQCVPSLKTKLMGFIQQGLIVQTISQKDLERLPSDLKEEVLMSTLKGNEFLGG